VYGIVRVHRGIVQCTVLIHTLLKGIFWIFNIIYLLPVDSSVSEDAAIQPGTVDSLVLAEIRRSDRLARSHHSRLDLILILVLTEL
jgi:hypothetical protein